MSKINSIISSILFANLTERRTTGTHRLEAREATTQLWTVNQTYKVGKKKFHVSCIGMYGSCIGADKTV